MAKENGLENKVNEDYADKDSADKGRTEPKKGFFDRIKESYNESVYFKPHEYVLGAVLLGCIVAGTCFLFGGNAKTDGSAKKDRSAYSQSYSPEKTEKNAEQIEEEQLSALEKKLKEGLALTVPIRGEELHVDDYHLFSCFLKKYVCWNSKSFKKSVDEHELRVMRDVWQQYKHNYDALLKLYITDPQVKKVVDRNPDLARMYPMPKRFFEPISGWKAEMLGRKKTINTNQAKSIRIDQGPSITPSDLEKNLALWGYHDAVQFNENKDIAMWMWFAGLINGVDPNFIFSVATLENNYGYSELYLKKKNMFGIHYKGGEGLLTVVDNYLDAFVYFSTRRGCVSYFADLIKDSYIKNGQDNVFDIANGIDGSNDYVGSGKVPWINGVMCNMHWAARKNPELYSDLAPKIREIENSSKENAENTVIAQNNTENSI